MSGALPTMRMRSALLLAFAALMIGAIAGGWGVGELQGRITTQWAGVSSAAEAGTTVWALERLRSGNTTKAVELLESKLDGALIGLGASLSSAPESRPSTHQDAPGSQRVSREVSA